MLMSHEHIDIPGLQKKQLVISQRCQEKKDKRREGREELKELKRKEERM